MSRTTELAVCFADICDSTALFETHGDDRAREIVGRTLDLIAEAIESHDGTVVKSLGDGIMGTFPEFPPAAHAAVQFPEVVKNDDTLAALDIEVRSGLCYGSVLQEEDGDVYGDAVNTASRLADWAHPSQVVTTVEARDTLPEYLQKRTRSLGETILRGKKEPVEIVELLGGQSGSDLTVAEVPTPTTTRRQERVLRLMHADDTVTVRQDPLWVGRGAKADLRVNDVRVSRMHAVVKKKRDSFQLVDQSTNGTYVQIGEEDALFLHHEQLLLHGTGHISLGRPLDTNDAHRLRFECVMDTPETP